MLKLQFFAGDRASDLSNFLTHDIKFLLDDKAHFRTVSENGLVLDTPITYSSIFERLKYFMRTLGLEDGETPRSLSAGCLVTLALSMLILDS